MQQRLQMSSIVSISSSPSDDLNNNLNINNDNNVIGGANDQISLANENDESSSSVRDSNNSNKFIVNGFDGKRMNRPSHPNQIDPNASNKISKDDNNHELGQQNYLGT